MLSSWTKTTVTPCSGSGSGALTSQPSTSRYSAVCCQHACTGPRSAQVRSARGAGQSGGRAAPQANR